MRRRRFFAVLAVVIVLMTGTRVGRGLAERRIKTLAGRFLAGISQGSGEVGYVRVGWRGIVEFRDVVLEKTGQSGERMRFELPLVRARCALPSLVRKTPVIKELTFDAPTMQMKTRAGQWPSPASAWVLKKGLAANTIRVTNGRFEIQNEDGKGEHFTEVFEPVQVSVTLKGVGLYAFRLSAMRPHDAKARIEAEGTIGTEPVVTVRFVDASVDDFYDYWRRSLPVLPYGGVASGELKWKPADGDVAAHIEVASSRLQWAGLSVDNAVATLTVNRCAFTLEKLEGELCGGTIRCVLSTELGSGGKQARARVKFKRLDLGKLPVVLPTWESYDARGLVDGTAVLAWQRGDYLSLSGYGWAGVSDGDLTDVPILKGLAGFIQEVASLGMGSFDGVVFDQAAGSFRLHGGLVETERAQLSGKELTVQAGGNVSFDGHVNVLARFGVSPEAFAGGVPGKMLAGIVDGISVFGVGVRIGGSLTKPSYKLVSVPVDTVSGMIEKGLSDVLE